jgi:hypothetical protein
MKMIINFKDGQIESVNCPQREDGEETLDYDAVIAACLALMDQATRQLCKGMEREDLEHLYDVLDTLFFRFMERVFPDVQPREFDLSDAGLLYAQDMIIKDANKNNLTYEEALKHYEDKAKSYVRQKVGKMS